MAGSEDFDTDAVDSSLTGRRVRAESSHDVRPEGLIPARPRLAPNSCDPTTAVLIHPAEVQGWRPVSAGSSSDNETVRSRARHFVTIVLTHLLFAPLTLVIAQLLSRASGPGWYRPDFAGSRLVAPRDTRRST